MCTNTCSTARCSRGARAQARGSCHTAMRKRIKGRSTQHEQPHSTATTRSRTEALRGSLVSAISSRFFMKITHPGHSTRVGAVCAAVCAPRPARPRGRAGAGRERRPGARGRRGRFFGTVFGFERCGTWIVRWFYTRPPHGPVRAREFLANSRLADRAPEQVAFRRRLPDGATSTHQSGRRSTSLPRGDLSSRSFGAC